MRALAGLCLVLALAGPSMARAQDDDWSLERPGAHAPRPHGRPHGTRPHGAAPPRPRPAAPSETTSGATRLVDRYREMVFRDPSESFALSRWVTLAAERDGSTEPLAAEMRALADADPAAIVPRLVLAHLARRAGRADEARTLYAAIVAAHPEDVSALAELARTEREQGQLGPAREHFETARTHARGETASALGREELEVLVDLGDAPAASALDATLAGPRPSVERRLELPRAWLAHHRPDDAIAALASVESAVAGDPRARIPVRMERARAELARGHTADALAALDDVLRTAGGGLRVEAYALAYDAHREAGTLDVLAARLRTERAPEALALLARLEDERGHDEEALAAYDRASRASPRDAELRERRAHVLLRMGRVDEAADALVALWRAAPDDPSRLIEAASLLVDQGRAADARTLLAAASAQRRSDVALHARLAETFARWGDDERALAEARILVRLEPREAQHRALLGDLLLARGDRAGALAAFREMAALDPSAAGHDRLGTTLADQDLLAEARTELLRATELAPDDRTALSHLVELTLREGRDADAEPLMMRLLALSAGDPALQREARAQLVALWARRGTLSRHVTLLEGAFGAEPPDLEAGATLAEALRRSGELDRAESVLERLATIAPADLDAWSALERVRTLRGDLAGAIDALEHAAAADPARAASYYARMSEHALGLYRDEDAIRYGERALALSPDDARGHVRLGDLHRRRGETAEAILRYRRALALDPHLFEVALEVAALTQPSDPAAADALYAQVIEASPDDDLVSRAIDASLEIELAAGDAEPLLDRLVTLALTHYERPLLGRAALGVVDVLARPLLPRTELPGAEGDAARASLRQIASRSLGILLRALSSTSPSEQQSALAVLARAGLEPAAPALLALGEQPGDGALAMEALLAAARVAGPSLVPRLTTLARGADPARARIAIWSLGRIGDATAIAALQSLVAHDGDAGAMAALALAHARAASARDAIVRASTTSGVARRSAFVIAAAALGRAPSDDDCAQIGEAGGTAAAVALTICPLEPAAAASLLLPAADARNGVRAALHRAGDLALAWPEPRPTELPASYALRVLDAAPAHEPSDALAAAVAQALVTGLGSASPALALHAIDAAGDGRLVLVALEGHTPPSFFGPRREAIVQALPIHAGDVAIRARAGRLLARLAPQDPRLDGLLADPEPAVVRGVLDGLREGTEATTRHAAALTTLLSSSADWVARLGAAQLLGRAEEGGEAALLAAAESDEVAFVREAALAAAAVRCVPGLGAVADRARGADPEARVRAAAAEAAGCGVR